MLQSPRWSANRRGPVAESKLLHYNIRYRAAAALESVRLKPLNLEQFLADQMASSDRDML
jgi:hypothetical protein